MPSCFYTTAGSRWTRPPIPGQMGLLPQTVKRGPGTGVPDRPRPCWAEPSRSCPGAAEAFRYYNEKGYLQFHRDGALKGEFVEGEFPIQEPESMDYTQQVLRLLEFEGDVVASTGTAGEEAVTTVVVQQSWKGAPLFRQELTLSYKNGCLVQVEGRRLNGEPGAGPQPGADLHPHHPVPVLSRRHRPWEMCAAGSTASQRDI